MAVTIEQRSAAELLAPEFLRYQALIRLERRRRYLGWAALGVSIAWLGASLLHFVDRATPATFLAAIGLTLLIPGLLFLFEASRQPTLAQTATSLDLLLDNRQRMITSVELLATGADKPIKEAQLASSAGILQQVNPRQLYPARIPMLHLIVAGGFLLLALVLFVLKDVGNAAPSATGTLPPNQNSAQAVASTTPQSSVPGAGPQSQQQQQQSGPSFGTPQPSGTSAAGSVSPQDAQQQAANSRDAQKALQRLAQALDQQSVTQSAADALRQGDYGSAAKDIADLGKNNDQLSDQAKQSMAGSLSSAANDSPEAPQLQNAEQNAATALTGGDYGVISDSLAALAQAIADTGRSVIPQHDLSKDFPDQQNQNGQQAQPNRNGQQGRNGNNSPSDQNGQQGQSGQNGQDQQDQNGQQNQGQNGQPGQSGSDQNGQNGQDSQNDQNGQQSAQDSQGSGSSTLPGEGSQVQGPAANKLNVAGNPFVIEGNPDPNANKPGNGSTPPAMTINGSPGGSTSATAPSQGGPVDANGENNSPPASRWGIVQKFFSGDGQQSQQNP